MISRSSFSLLVAVLACAMIIVATPAAAKECRMRKGGHVWRHGGGTFRRLPGSLTWEETNDKGEVHGRFQERSRESGGIIIHNAEREISILLRDDLAGIQSKGQNGFQQLYRGSWAKIVDCT